MTSDPADAERFPLLTDAGRRMLLRLREHPAAPNYNIRLGDRLTADRLARVRAYADRIRAEPPRWAAGQVPDWVRRFAGFCRAEVPFHRHRGDWADEFAALPPTTREDIRREPWAHVPDSAALDELMVYWTSGTTGEKLHIPAPPEAPARYLPLMQAMLADHGIALSGGERVSIVQVCAQRRTMTTASVMSLLDGAGFVKANLNPADWRDPADRVRFLDDCAPELVTGDPFALSVLAGLPVTLRPKAMVCSGAGLPGGLRTRLTERFACPVFDLYSSNEAGPVAYSAADGAGHRLLQPGLFAEVVAPDGRPCPPGVRGEIVLTGGVNPMLPLLRYRTGDFAAMEFPTDGPPVLTGLEGRAPVVFARADGSRFNSVDVSTALGPLPLPWFRVHQAADGMVSFRTRCEPDVLTAAAAVLREVFGPGVEISADGGCDDAWDAKTIRYSGGAGLIDP